jgi:hypothetical protein
MKKHTYNFVFALLLMLGMSITVNATPWYNPATLPASVNSGTTLIIEMGYGTSRVGLSSQSTPVAFQNTLRHDHINFKGDFAKLMNEAYSRLNISDKSNLPVLVIEPNSFNSWRRVDMADVIMGDGGHPWMYVMSTGMILAYGNDPGSGTVTTYHIENGQSTIVPVVGGWPYEIGYGVDFDYVEEELVRAADSVFWTSVRCPYADRGDLLNNIVLSGSGWNDITPAEIAEFEERINIQRLLLAHDPRVVGGNGPRDLEIWRGCKKLINDGILLSWDLAYTQSHYTTNGAEYIRQWVF